MRKGRRSGSSCRLPVRLVRAALQHLPPEGDADGVGVVWHDGLGHVRDGQLGPYQRAVQGGARPALLLALLLLLLLLSLLLLLALLPLLLALLLLLALFMLGLEAPRGRLRRLPAGWRRGGRTLLLALWQLERHRQRGAALPVSDRL
jgi:hypothetical protein